MRNHAASATLAIVLVTAALLPGAAVFVRATTAVCPEPIPGTTIEERAAVANVIVLGVVSGPDDRADGGRVFGVRPEAFLKGTATAGTQAFALAPADADCPVADVSDGDRVLIFALGSSPFAWPHPDAVFIEHPEGWRSANPSVSASYGERQLLDRVRAVTEQFAVPAMDDGEGAGIDWMKTVLPIGGVLLGLMAVGLVLMRIWHRIDPS